MVVKYADNILKNFANALSVIFTVIGAMPLFGQYPSIFFLFGVLGVLLSVFMYGKSTPSGFEAFESCYRTTSIANLQLLLQSGATGVPSCTPLVCHSADCNTLSFAGPTAATTSHPVLSHTSQHSLILNQCKHSSMLTDATLSFTYIYIVHDCMCVSHTQHAALHTLPCRQEAKDQGCIKACMASYCQQHNCHMDGFQLAWRLH